MPFEAGYELTLPIPDSRCALFPESQNKPLIRAQKNLRNSQLMRPNLHHLLVLTPPDVQRTEAAPYCSALSVSSEGARQALAIKRERLYRLSRSPPATDAPSYLRMW